MQFLATLLTIALGITSVQAAACSKNLQQVCCIGSQTTVCSVINEGTICLGGDLYCCDTNSGLGAIVSINSLTCSAMKESS